MCEVISREGTVIVEEPQGLDCLTMKQYGIPPLSDIDGDGIDDICDDDIDGDGIKNTIGFVEYTDEYLSTYQEIFADTLDDLPDGVHVG